MSARHQLSAGAVARLAAAALLAGCSGPAPAPDELRLGRGIEITHRAAAPPDLELFRALSIAVAGDVVLVLNGGSREILRLDSSLGLQGTLGAGGSGPAEFRFALDMATRGDTVAVGDIGNGRVLFLDLVTGREVRTVATPFAPASLAVLDDGSVLVPSSDPGSYLMRVFPDGALEDFAPRPDSATGANSLVRACGDDVFVLDNESLLLHRYDTSGDLRRTFRLPARIHNALVSSRNQKIAGFRRQGIAVLDITTIKAMTIVDCERPLLLFGHDRAFGLVVDPKSGRAVPLVLPDGPAEREFLRRASSVAIAGSSLIVLSNDEMRSYAFR